MITIASMLLCVVVAMSASTFASTVASTSASPVAQWPVEFYQTFNETTSVLHGGVTSGRMWYSSSMRMERVDREQGQYDRYCGSVDKTSGPCTHLVRQDGKRYLIWPDKKKCYMCCDASKGCGLLSSDWLKTAQFIGQQEYQGQQCYQWNIKGLQMNSYYATEKGVPCRLYQAPNDDMLFDLNTFLVGPFDESVFAMPSYKCDAHCPLFSICTIA
jgi:hypothetical protein